MTIKELEQKEIDLLLELKELKEAIYQSKLADACIKIGDVVISNNKEYKITRVDFWNYGPWAYGLVKNKNGDYGKREVCLYKEWELKK